MTAAPGMTKAASCGAMAPHIPRMGLSFVCVLAPGHSGDHSAGMVQWSQALHAAAHPSITHTVEVGMTNDPRAQSEQSDVEWLREISVTFDSPSGAEKVRARFAAIADSIERRDAEIVELKADLKETAAVRDDACSLIAETNNDLRAARAERDALAALVREAAPELKIMYPLHFEKWLARADEALRAPQTGGVNE